MGSVAVICSSGTSRLELSGHGPRLRARLVAPDLEAAASFLDEASELGVTGCDVKTFFADLARRWMDDASAIAYRSPDQGLAMGCSWDGRGHFCLEVTLRGVAIDRAPVWSLSATLHLETGALARLAEQAREL